MLCLALLSLKHDSVLWNWYPFWLIVSCLRASPASYSHGQHPDTTSLTWESREVSAWVQYELISTEICLTTQLCTFSWCAKRSCARTILVHMVNRHDRHQVFPSNVPWTGLLLLVYSLFQHSMPEYINEALVLFQLLAFRKLQ